MRKIYNVALHNRAREAEFAVMKFLKENEEIFGTPTHCGDTDFTKDIVTTKLDIEVEWREKHWLAHQEEFPYLTITIPARKQYKIPRLYFVVRADCKKTIMFGAEEFQHAKHIIKDNIYANQEEFIELKREDGEYFDLN